MGKKKAKARVRERAVMKFYKNKVKYEEVVFNLLKQKLNNAGSDMDDRIQSGDLCKGKQRR